MELTNQPSEILPIFPLNAVIFPDAMLPLHIFEERYKILICECLAEGKEFGINLIHEQKIRSIGCTVIVSSSEKKYDDGTMDIVVKGRRRYTLLALLESPHPYHIGKISYYDDIKEEPNDELLKHAITLYNRFVKIAFKGMVPQAQRKPQKSITSFFLVQKSGLELIQRQLFLSMDSENKRLEFLVQHYESLLPIIIVKQKFEEIIMNDGYLQEL